MCRSQRLITSSNLACQTHHPWALRCIEAKPAAIKRCLALLRGGIFRDLREESAAFLSRLDLPGYAIGGLAVGENKADMYQVLDWMHPVLPHDKPRYLMGVGAPEDLVNGVLRGIDIFDCVLPTRLARHSSVWIPGERLNLRNARFERDGAPIMDSCACYTCRHFSRAYLRHLVKATKSSATFCSTTHNVTFCST